MDKRVRGITIEIDGETKRLDEALKGVEKTSRDLQSELRQVEKALKLDPTNTVLLTQKKKLLGDAVAASSEKLSALKLAQQQASQAFAEGKIGEEQYRAIQREVIAAEGELKKLRVTLAETNNGWRTAAEKVGKFGAGVSNLGSRLVPVSAGAAAALGGIVALTTRAAQGADDLNTLAAKTGITTEQLQRLRYASEFIDVPMETMTGALGRLTMRMGDAAGGNEALTATFDKLGVKVVDGDGKLRDRQTVFMEMITALGEVTNETERNVISMEIFGRSAQELNPMIKAGADEIHRLGEEAASMGLIMGQDAVDDLNKFNDSMDKTRAQLSATSDQLGAEMGKILLPLLQSFSESLQGVLRWVQGLDQGTATLILGVLAVVAALAPLLIIIGKVATAISGIMGLMAALKVAAAAKGVAVGALVAPFALVAAAIAAAIAIGVLLYRNWGEIMAFGVRLRDSVVQSFNHMRDQIVAAFNRLREINLVDVGRSIIQGLINGITGMIAAVGGAVRNVAQGAVSAVKGFLGIRSPSRVFMELGKASGEGFVAGIEATQSLLARATAAMGRSAVGGTEGAFTPAVAAAAGSAAYTGPLFTIQSMTVRSDADIDHLSRQLHRHIQAGMRAKGGR